jgi:hypothetical protein
MIRRKCPGALEDNGSRSPREKPATPGGADGQLLIYAIIEEHGYLLALNEGDSKQLAAGSWQLVRSLHAKGITRADYAVFDIFWPNKLLPFSGSYSQAGNYSKTMAASCELSAACWN